MGICYSCDKSKDKFKAKICSQIHSAVSPCHVSQQQQQQQQQQTATCSGQTATNGHRSKIQSGSVKHRVQEERHRHKDRLVPLGDENESMAASFPNMNLTNPIKGLVSKKRNRYKKDGFNLDLTYITPNIIAMGYPASKIEGVYRNHIDDVVKFLDTKHRDHYYIYNLCSERSYDKSKFHNRVHIFPFDDHNPPRIESIEPFCTHVQRWLSADKDNVAVVHCKAGKGRTGTMICCYLMHANVCKTAESALSTYGLKRTQDKKGVTIPSQVRYVQYYETLLRNKLKYKPMSMNIKEFHFSPPPNLAGGQNSLTLRISHQTDAYDGMPPKCKKLREDSFDVKKGQSPLIIRPDYCVALKGDIKIEFYQKTKIREEKLFQFWFNTYFVSDRVSGGAANGYVTSAGVGDDLYELCFQKSQLDIVNKKDKQNKQFSADFQLRVILQQIPKDAARQPTCIREPAIVDVLGGQDSPSECSDSSDEYTNEDDEEDEWDSDSRSGSRPHSQILYSQSDFPARSDNNNRRGSTWN
ncbi:phosphatidylinositol 3,4,5-trisphosphate 3-phosphatase and dual-specificity protein phosphatase PTEN isoform X1 [Aethina tumida]|uniref:phosphatidylinositol 3,4,5-trisphosphate 3-phosphatase and dual-specificity protein phosphatase PTEN isoform X1 n=1 Tax=Aethina tumida TaxID=116153 RepID=UPI00214956F1|nr:phosphatidylinositol 3,4,5-trisphosphate 3-phosphatase and dual-specificity protein phosphatase PTEN isoform X1 [Aethina tumida]XP_019868747.2 phosphatidylinositol 3,4,5-trisphosphate 3-phosphatase and dual-specificity protein phosphatase PTEN isoform X1 [Aethina tumida]XP_019868748.2 phosphatidylinositol 3,4,5-trisphosphate 3-phosphatase and dual-specificity protein phosphatase PTEN isoform X1 [Aethina tumida]XP_049817168.1 phosphatidylinositol 3,4,5-trisphosphate 3-phosphatase and dual-spec